jgi:hypothetical protein
MAVVAERARAGAVPRRRRGRRRLARAGAPVASDPVTFREAEGARSASVIEVEQMLETYPGATRWWPPKAADPSTTHIHRADRWWEGVARGGVEPPTDRFQVPGAPLDLSGSAA